jgi:uncharacterized Zn-finger protein
VIIPDPVGVIVLPEIVADPETTLSVTGRPELAAGGAIVNGTPNVWAEIAAKGEIVCDVLLTKNVTVCWVAAE